MKLAYSYRSLIDWGDVTRGEEFVRLLASAGLTVEKVDNKEPVRRDFAEQELPSYWAGRGLPDQHSTCYFLFKGSRPVQFSGMVTWKRNLPEETLWMNTLHMDMTISGKSQPESAWLLDLGDKLFEWAYAVHGFITVDTLYNPLGRPPAKRLFIPKLFWVNYFGRGYLSSPDFRLHDPGVDLPNGKRVVLGSGYDDPCLADETFLRSVADEIGLGWFGEGNANEYRMPEFDFRALWRTGRSSSSS